MWWQTVPGGSWASVVKTMSANGNIMISYNNIIILLAYIQPATIG